MPVSQRAQCKNQASGLTAYFIVISSDELRFKGCV
jgi:hypothetical protein